MAALKKSPDVAVARRALPIVFFAARAISPKFGRRVASLVKSPAKSLHMLGVDEHGLDEVDRNLMIALLDKYAGGPVGLGTLAAALQRRRRRNRGNLRALSNADRNAGSHAPWPRSDPRAYEYFQPRTAEAPAPPLLAKLNWTATPRLHRLNLYVSRDVRVHANCGHAEQDDRYAFNCGFHGENPPQYSRDLTAGFEHPRNAVSGDRVCRSAHTLRTTSKKEWD